ncbi:exostosin family protein [Striga asiatica]|uniref:Exostosin family protein n=1 Tax=Striga asiatica TaxID=4170 RepID=A0A5A7PNL2_STRAF|nr:exostosin family protein [Striga asiatica]
MLCLSIEHRSYSTGKSDYILETVVKRSGSHQLYPGNVGDETISATAFCRSMHSPKLSSHSPIVTLVSFTYLSLKPLHSPSLRSSPSATPSPLTVQRLLPKVVGDAGVDHAEKVFVPEKEGRDPSDDAEDDIYHLPKVFRLNYEEMMRQIKVYIYSDGDPNTYYQTPRKLTGKYASEGYVFQNLRESNFTTDDPDRADLFFIPISCHKMRGKIRVILAQVWENDTELDISNNRINRATGHLVYQKRFYRTKFCICPGGSQVNSARVADSIHYGCIPVILSNYYDLPFNDILNWHKFSVVLKEKDVYQLKQILKNITQEEFVMLHNNLVKVQKHFQWNTPPQDHDAFHMVMYELWLRHHVIKLDHWAALAHESACSGSLT